MSSILYYSNMCNNSKRLLQQIGNSTVKDDMHFICVDQRTKKNNGAVYIILQNGQELLLPPTITKVPALLLLNRGHHVLFGEEIERFIEPQHKAMLQSAVVTQGEPEAFSLDNGSQIGYGVSSDCYSFLDQDAEELSAKGVGGMRQQHHYAAVEHRDLIETPPDNYSADTIGNTIGNVSLETLQQQRQQDLK